MAILLLISQMEPDVWDEAIERLSAVTPVRIWPYMADPLEIEYAIVWKPPHGALKGFPNLRAIFSMGAGVDHLTGDRNLPDVPIVRFVADDLTEHMSEYVLHHVLLHHRRHLDYAAQQARKDQWRPLPQPTARDVRVGVMGCGVLGAAAAAKLAAIGFQTAGWSRTRKAYPGVHCYAGSEEFLTFLGAERYPREPAAADASRRAACSGSKLIAAMAADGALPGGSSSMPGAARCRTKRRSRRARRWRAVGGLAGCVRDRAAARRPARCGTHPRVVVTPHNARRYVSRPCRRAAVVKAITCWSRLAKIRAAEKGLDLRTWWTCSAAIEPGACIRKFAKPLSRYPPRCHSGVSLDRRSACPSSARFAQ